MSLHRLRPKYLHEYLEPLNRNYQFRNITQTRKDLAAGKGPDDTRSKLITTTTTCFLMDSWTFQHHLRAFLKRIKELQHFTKHTVRFILLRFRLDSFCRRSALSRFLVYVLSEFPHSCSALVEPVWSPR